MAENEENVVDWEAEARKIGWAPKDQFRGDPNKWVDAKDYVERGQQFIPLLKASNRGLQDEVAALREQNMAQARLLEANTKALGDLQKQMTTQTVKAAESSKEELIDGIEAAREKGDVRAELALRERLDSTNAAIREAKSTTVDVPATTVTAPPQPDLTKHPDFVAFETANPWFRENRVMAGTAVAILSDMNAKGELRGATPAERFAEVAKRTKAIFEPKEAHENVSRVEGSRNDGSSPAGPSRNGKGFNELPAEAKASCDAFATSFVGVADARGKIRFPDMKAWQAHYAQEYFGKKDDT